MNLDHALDRLTREESRLSLAHMDAEDRYGQDSPEERAALERATDVTAEREMVADWLEGIE